MLALTFDDGPDPRGTPAVLEALAGASVRATFFVLGERVVAHRELLARIAEAGHAIEVHGHAHLRHPLTSPAVVAADLQAALAALGESGVRPGRWRVPWGDLAVFSGQLAAANRLNLTGWTLDTHDWRGNSATHMLAAVTPGLQTGAVVLMHDGVGPGALRLDCRETAALVGPLVHAARRQGLDPGPLTDAWDVPAGNPDLDAAVRE